MRGKGLLAVALSFSGSGQFLSTVTGMVTAVPITFAVWVNRNTSAIDSAVISVSAATNANIFMLDLNSGVPRASIKFGGTFAAATAGSAIAIGAWVFLVAVFTDATTRTIYVNGVAAASNNTSGTPVSIVNTQIAALVGGNLFSGSIAYPAIWNAALSPGEISTLYNGGNGSDPTAVQPLALRSFHYLPSGGGPYVDSQTGTTWALSGSPTFIADPFVLVAPARPYVDPFQAQNPAFEYSYYLQPWKAYMDTWPGTRLLDCLGINFNAQTINYDATAEVLSYAGFTHARAEIGWGNFTYTNENVLLSASQTTFTSLLTSLKKWGLRPLIVLNANSQLPCPNTDVPVTLQANAPIGASTITLALADVPLAVPNFTGLSGQSGNTNLMAFPLITSGNGTTGVMQLSSPLTVALTAGPLILKKLKYHPLSRNDQANPFSANFMTGWATYTTNVCNFVKGVLGNNDFDIEIWNEIGFGSEFLDENNYYAIDQTGTGTLSYTTPLGYVRTGREVLEPITVDVVNASFPGVRTINGFSNQRSSDSGSSMFPGEWGYSRHFYTTMRIEPATQLFNGDSGVLVPPSTNFFPTKAPINAIGQWDGTPVDLTHAHTVNQGSFFVPSYTMSCPESYSFGTVYNNLIRDTQPFPNPQAAGDLTGAQTAFHWRGSANLVGETKELWQTETNCGRNNWTTSLQNQAGVGPTDQRLIDLSHFMGAKNLLRTFVFHAHKGIQTVFIYAARSSDLIYATIPTAFFDSLTASGGVLQADALSKMGPQLAAIGRLTKFIKPYIQTQSFAVNSVTVAALTAPNVTRLIFAGDGSSAHPDIRNLDRFGVFPFQLNPSAYAILYYPVTHNMVQNFGLVPGDVLDQSNYRMPEETYDITINGINFSSSAQVIAYDPLTDVYPVVTVLSRTSTQLVLRVLATDYPRCLLVSTTFWARSNRRAVF